MNSDFAEIVRQESQRLYGLCFRLTGNAHDAEDLCQDVFARALRYFHQFEGRSQVSTWLYRIAMNTWKNKIRSKKKATIFSFFRSGDSSSDDDEDGAFLEPEGHEAPPDDPYQKSESDQLLQMALMALSPDEREMITLRDLEEKSYEEMASLLNIPMGTVKSRLARAREALRLKLVPLLKAKGELV